MKSERLIFDLCLLQMADFKINLADYNIKILDYQLFGIIYSILLIPHLVSFSRI